MALGLKTSLQVAEELKISHGTCSLASITDDEEITVSVLGEDAGRTLQRRELCEIIVKQFESLLTIAGSGIEFGSDRV